MWTKSDIIKHKAYILGYIEAAESIFLDDFDATAFPVNVIDDLFEIGGFLLPLYIHLYPQDNRPKNLLEATKGFMANQIPISELKKVRGVTANYTRNIAYELECDAYHRRVPDRQEYR